MIKLKFENDTLVIMEEFMSIGAAGGSLH